MENDLINRVRMAQVQAGEQAVISHLKEIGLVKKEPSFSLFDFLSQYSKVGSTEVRMVLYPMAKWKKTGEKGIHVYCHFINVDSQSKDYFISKTEVKEIGNNISDFIEYGE